MKSKFFICMFLLGFGVSSIAQNYVIYDVKPNDTPTSIAQANSISLQQLYKYNPDLKNTKSIDNQKIVIPKSDDKNFGFYRYRVKTLETLYSISRNFNLSIADIKAFNPQLYKNELKAGEVLRLPAYKLPEAYQDVDFNQSIKNSNFTAFKHIVLPNERKSDIIEKYDMSLQAFDSLNPNIIEVQSGQLVKVMPTKTESDPIDMADLDMKLQYYKVPKQQTLYSLSKEFKISEDIIFKLNPIVRREGLKANTIIKLPEKVEALGESEIVNLENYIQNFNEKKLALFLPFSLNQFEKDSVNKKNILRRDNLLNITLDIYAGVQWAIEHAKSKRIYTDLKVFDTKRNPRVMDSILAQNKLSDRDAIIGPILNFNIDNLTKSTNSQIPIFLPITKSNSKSSLVFNTIPEQNLKTETLITYLDSIYSSEQNLVFITDSTAIDRYEKYKYTFPNARFYHPKKSSIETENLMKLLVEDGDNLVVLETDQIGITESVINNLYRFNKGYTPKTEDEEEDDKEKEREVLLFPTRLFTSDRNVAFGEIVENNALGALNFTYTSVSKYDILETNPLIEDFINKNNYIPSRYVLRAFDLTYDILLRLAYNGNLNDGKGVAPLTEYNENRFGYEKSFMTDTYQNQGLYIIKYDPDLEIEILNAKKL